MLVLKKTRCDFFFNQNLFYSKRDFKKRKKKKKKKAFYIVKIIFEKRKKDFFFFKKKKIYKNFLFGRLFRVLNRRLFENIFSLENGGHWGGHHILYLLPLRPPFPNDVRILTPKVR